MTDIKKLNYEEITLLQKQLDSEINNRIEKYFKAIKLGDIQEIKDFIEWGIPQNNPIYFEAWNKLTLTVTTPVPVLDALSSLGEKYPNQYTNFIHKLYLLLNDVFRSVDKVKKIENPNFTEILQWALNKHPSLFKETVVKDLHDSWGNIYFDPQRHAQLEGFVLNDMNRPFNTLKRISQSGNKEQLTYFYDENKKYVKELNKIENKEEFLQSCLDKAIISTNRDAVLFWLEKGVKTENTKTFAHLIQQNFRQENFFNIIDDIVKYYQDVTFGNQILLRSAIMNNRLEVTKYLLEKYYIDNETVPKLKDLIKNNAKHDSVTFLKQYEKFMALSVQLDDNKNNARKMKI